MAASSAVTADYVLKPPPYSLDALEPHMSRQTLEFHWGKHHRAYVDNLKKQVLGSDLEGKTLDHIILNTYNNGDLLPAFNNAAQAWNHEFFWESMKPGGGGKPSGELLALLERDFTSYEKFYDEFNAAAATQFGAGWAWLAYADNKLKVMKTPNAVNPLVLGSFPLLTIDVWGAFLCSPLPSCSVAIFSKSNTDGFRSSPSCRLRLRPISASHILAPAIDRSAMVISETVSEDELWAAACLRVRTFNELNPSSYNIQDHRRYLAEREFEALKERVSGKREGFTRVSCVNATLPLSQLSTSSEDFFSACKFSDGIEDRVVVGSLDLNQCRWLPDEIAGTKPEGFSVDFARAYLSNVCVAKELHRNGVGYKLIEKSKVVAREWGITDMYVHVTVVNEAAKRLYMKCGFEQESAEPAWQARYLNRPQRLLLWLSLPTS